MPIPDSAYENEQLRELNPEIFGKRKPKSTEWQFATEQPCETCDEQTKNKPKRIDPIARRDQIVKQTIIDGLSPCQGESIVEWNDTFKMVLFGERPLSQNVFHAGIHFKKRSDEVKRIKTLVQMGLFEHGMTGRKCFNHVVQIQIGVFMVHPAYDTNNAAVKSYVDALQKFVITADDLRFVDYVLPFVQKVDADPRVEILVGKLEWRKFLP